MNSQKVIDEILKQDLASAEISLELALQADSIDSIEELGDALMRLGFIQWAQRVYEKILEIDSKNSHVKLSLAEIAIEDGQSEKALDYLLAVPETDEAYATALMLQADLYQAEGLLDVAELKIAAAVKLTDEPLVKLGLAEILFEAGKFSQAIKNYATLDATEILEETRISIFERIGTCYAYLGKYEHAISFFEKALEIEMTGQSLWELANLYYSLAEYDKANIYFNQLAMFEPDFEDYQYLYAKSLMAEELLPEAAAVIKDGLSRNQYQPKLLHLASENSYRLHQFDLAESYLWEALKLPELNDETVRRLANLLIERNQFATVKQLLTENRKINELDSISLWNLAKAYQGLDEISSAVEIYQLASEALQADPEFLKDYALFARENALSLLKPLQLLEAYLENYPNDSAMFDLFSSFND
ncbi:MULTISPECIES: tetratricopeptide repeat protein [unclassified Enterococcus]|uniref:tetratricopeptide repeat protein n=1 Tax=unclassified Enterococcus TaxID=2608891 RepID=UPI0015576B6B|nr:MULTISPECIES: tetratricopeptide repeat protein [unclassified Enterococcus]MBS7576294.1 tetratricopeptide repeat protein [Enterococcus sp. MMGLQ5-2]MBS7583527.1 tetratricopeptide repeat protein [Enterococcus sp. MMGLQ5-1]NPD11389.1 tetratricopeptide repeat protein [Enterococcus sp. MMGLQ5-1]NPD36132.1 tetratricopeptide repeat protein [Enterococcus sp. MMGLQ5-2]